MLIGEYFPSIDSKGRVNFPSRLRESLGESFIITKGLDNCLCVYTLEDWEKLSQKTMLLPSSKARKIQRFLFSGACEVTPDKQGRISIPQNLRDYADLNDEIAVVGVSVRAEIWNLERWNKANEELTSESMAEAMEELGF